MFVDAVVCDWVRAQRAAGADPHESASTLLDWMEADDYGYFHRIEKSVAAALDRKGLAAFERVVRDRWLVVHPQDREAGYRHRQAIEILKAVCVRRKDAAGYRSVCDEAGELSPADCGALADICLARRRGEDALDWVERGLALEKEKTWPRGSAWGLESLRRKILLKVGRADEAVAVAWDAYQNRPSKHSLADLLEYAPEVDRADWIARAIDALPKALLGDQLGVLMELAELDRIAALVERVSRQDLERLSHFTTEPVAEALKTRAPLLAAKVFAALGLRIVESNKSKYYVAAHRHFEDARDLLLANDGARTCADLVREVCRDHSRKSSFMPGFERLVHGASIKNKPAFLDQAKARWRNRGNEELTP